MESKWRGREGEEKGRLEGETHTGSETTSKPIWNSSAAPRPPIRICFSNWLKESHWKSVHPELGWLFHRSESQWVISMVHTEPSPLPPSCTGQPVLLQATPLGLALCWQRAGQYVFLPFWLLIAALRSLEWLLMRASFYSACVSFFEPRTSIILWSCNSLALEKTGGG